MALSSKQRIRKYGYFTPAGIAEALEIARTMVVPRGEIPTVGVRISQKITRHNLDLPVPISYRLARLSKARGISFNQTCTEILTYYVVAISEAALDGVPELYADFTTPEGLKVLTSAMAEAFARVINGRGESVSEVVDELKTRSRMEPVPRVDVVRDTQRAKRVRIARGEVAPAPPPVPEPEPEPTALDTFSLTGEDELPTLCITIRGATADAVCRGLEDVRGFVRDHDVEEWDGVKGAEPGYEYECSALDDGTPVRDLHATVTKALVAR